MYCMHAFNNNNKNRQMWPPQKKNFSCAKAQMWRPEDNLWELGLSFNQVLGTELKSSGLAASAFTCCFHRVFANCPLQSSSSACLWQTEIKLIIKVQQLSTLSVSARRIWGQQARACTPAEHIQRPPALDTQAAGSCTQLRHTRRLLQKIPRSQRPSVTLGKWKVKGFAQSQSKSIAGPGGSPGLKPSSQQTP